MMKQLERFAVVIAGVLLAGTLAVGTGVIGEAPTPRTRPEAVPSATRTLPAPDTGTATQPAGRVPAPFAIGRHPRPEEIVRLPLQIQAQVAGTVLTAAPLVSEAELLRLPWQIQDQVRQAQLAPTN